MRDASQDANGLIKVNASISKHIVDHDRYLRFAAGETFADIALKDGVLVDTVKNSVTNGRKMHEAEQIMELRDLKHRGAIGAERIRKRVREECDTLIVDGVVKLLKGKRTVASVRKSDGEIITEEFDDPDVISMGIEHARKIISLDEKPAQSQTFVNIQNNQNVGDVPSTPNALSYEERLMRIRSAQTHQKVVASQQNDVIDVESQAVMDPAINVEISGPPPDDTADSKDFDF